MLFTNFPSSQASIHPNLCKDATLTANSASSPTFAALVSLLNNARLAQGKKPLGFLNPWFYSHANAKGGFTDIKDGRSTGCTGVDIYSGLPSPYVPGAGMSSRPYYLTFRYLCTLCSRISVGFLEQC